jgi:hypothetical protein
MEAYWGGGIDPLILDLGTNKSARRLEVMEFTVSAVIFFFAHTGVLHVELSAMLTPFTVLLSVSTRVLEQFLDRNLRRLLPNYLPWSSSVIFTFYSVL